MTGAAKRFASRVRSYLSEPALKAVRAIPRQPDAATQILLAMEYQRLVRDGVPLPSLADIGFKAYSQTDEDGILLFIFAIIGAPTKRCVEICAGNGVECNTANLILNLGWHGLLVDGNPTLVEQGERFYRQSPLTFVFPPRFVHSWVTRDNVNGLVAEHGFGGEIDLLSIDLDGMDYWIWEALHEARPRVVVVEYQDILGPERSCTVPYSDQFDASAYPMSGKMPNFAGASLAAFAKLARGKGYRLVGVNRYGYNAFFVRRELGQQALPEVPVANCFTHPKVIAGMRDRFPLVKDLPWVDV